MSDIPSAGDFEINIPEPYLVAMGKVNVAWGVLESVVDLAFARLAGYATVYDPRPVIVTAHMTWPLKMDVLGALADQLRKEHPELGQWETVAKPALRKAQEARNSIAHGHWMLVNGTVRRLHMSARGKLRASARPVPLSQIEAALTDVSAAGRVVLKVVFGA